MMKNQNGSLKDCKLQVKSKNNFDGMTPKSAQILHNRVNSLQQDGKNSSSIMAENQQRDDSKNNSFQIEETPGAKPFHMNTSQDQNSDENFT